MTHLVARLERETEATDWGSFDVRDRPALDRIGQTALEETLQQLRSVAGWIEINTHLTSLQMEYALADGKPLPWQKPIYVSFQGVGRHALDFDQWHAVAAAVAARERVSLPDELIMEALRFLRQRNYRFAVVSAAVACEVLLRQRIVEALSGTGGITAARALEFFQDVSNRDLTALLPCFFTVADGLVDELREVLNQRNLILHGRQRKQPSSAQAQQAIAVARKLKSVASRGPNP